MERKTEKVKMSEEKIYRQMALNNNKFSKCSQERPTNLMSQKREGGSVFAIRRDRNHCCFQRF